MSTLKLKTLVIFIIAVVANDNLQGQNIHKIRGVSFYYYDQKIGSTSLEKDYLNRSYTATISQKSKLIALPVAALTIDFQTQLGITNVSDHQGALVEKGIETALLLGLNLEIALLPKTFWFYVGGSIGPQFISNAPSRQDKGFVFSDSVYAGSRVLLSRSRQLDIKGGFRHQSNAGISEPNGGINSLYLSVGLYSVIK